MIMLILKAGMKMMKKKRHMHMRPGLRMLLIIGAVVAALAGIGTLIGKKATR